jgi:hypothetical protein
LVGFFRRVGVDDRNDQIDRFRKFLVEPVLILTPGQARREQIGRFRIDLEFLDRFIGADPAQHERQQHHSPRPSETESDQFLEHSFPEPFLVRSAGDEGRLAE